MIPLLEEKRDSIADLCRRYHIARLEVFGSAADEGFDPARSDIDLLVEFAPGQDLGPWLSLYFEFRDAASQLLGRPIDLVLASAPRNPYFIREMNRTRRLLYAA